ncbi:MAG: trypsin-like serine protease [Anaerolineales bacterium]|jgi:hypothetical protein
MLRKLFILTLTLVLLLVIASVAYAITYGELDGEGHPYVGLALFYDDGDNYLWRCSGTLIGEKLFLTAGHCTYGTSYAKVMFDSDLEQLEWVNDDLGYVSCDPYTCYEGWTEAHPEYDDYWSQFPNTYDLGLVHLKKKVKMENYGEVADVGALDGLETKLGQKDLIIRTVGYGLQSGYPREENEKIRYTSTSKIIELNSANTGGFGIHTSNNPSEVQGEGGACMGDSGGPIFYPADSNIVVGVVSWGNNYNCVGADYGYRTDTQIGHDFIFGQ